MPLSTPGRGSRLLLLLLPIAFAVIACGSVGSMAVGTSPNATLGPAASAQSPTMSTRPAATDVSTPAPITTAGPTESEPPDTGGRTTSGDVPDNAVFLTYRGGSPPFSIDYVEGWQVNRLPDGVVIRDKDSSETVAIVAPQTDPSGYIATTDLPALQAQPGFSLGKQDTVKVGAKRYVHLSYHLPAPPDPVTGKQVPSTVDRYYVPGPNGLAIVSLSTPDGVDNVDAFRQMIGSFRWS